MVILASQVLSELTFRVHAQVARVAVVETRGRTKHRKIFETLLILYDTGENVVFWNGCNTKCSRDMFVLLQKTVVNAQVDGLYAVSSRNYRLSFNQTRQINQIIFIGSKSKNACILDK